MKWFAPPVLHPDYVGREYRLVDNGKGKYYIEYKEPDTKQWIRLIDAWQSEFGTYREDWTGSERRGRKQVDKMARQHYNQWFREKTKGKIIYLGRKP